MSFRLKTILGIALIEGVLLMLLVWSGMDYLNYSNRNAMLKQATTTAKLFVALKKDAVLTTDLATLEEALDELIATPGVIYIRVKSHESILVERGSDSALAKPFVEDDDLLNVDDGVFDIKEDVVVAGQVFGSIELGLSTLEMEALLAEAKKRFYIIAAVEMLLVALFSFILGTYLTAMLTKLVNGVKSISKGELGTQIEVKGSDELASTAEAFNSMSRRLHESNFEMEQSIAASWALSEQLKSSELRSRTILNTAVDGFIIINYLGVIQEVNAAGAQTFGYEAEQLKGMNVKCLMPQPYSDEHDGYIENYLQTGNATIIGRGREVTGLRQDGTTFPMDLSISEMQLGEDKMFVGLVRDISEKRAIETAARRSEALKLAIVEASLDALVTIDSDGKVLEFSPVAEAMFNYHQHEVIGKKMSELIVPPELREMHERGMAHYLQSGEGPVLGKRIEITAMRRGGEVFPVELTISPISISGTIIFTAFIRDITERKQAELDLNDARIKAEAASEAKSRFLAHMSHEIRSPLNAVLGSLDLIQDSPLNQEQHQYAYIAQNSGKALLGVINDVLDFSKIEAGELQLNANRFNPGDLVISVIEMISYHAIEKNIEIVSVQGENIPALLRGDSSRIRQVLINLLANAVKFTEQGAVVLKMNIAQENESSVMLHCSVEDTGEGIAEEAVPALFDEFSQVDNSDATRFGGTGLGLAICKQLVELMGGEIGVESQVNVGSRFWFEIPLELVEKAKLDTSIGSNQRVLVVGMARLAREAIAEQYQNLGCQSESVATGREALQCMQATDDSSYQYVLIDENIEDIDLLLLAKRARSETTGNLVLIQSNYIDMDVKRAGKLGFDKLLRHPFHTDNLKLVLNNLSLTTAKRHVTIEKAQHESKQGNLLLVEDSETNQMLAKNILECEGYKVDVACDGREAVDAFERFNYDLILMDLRMPNMSGLEATERIRKMKSGNDIPVIAMTANALQTDIDRCLSAGMNDYITKPFERANLLRVISQWLGKSMQQGSDVPELKAEYDSADSYQLVNDEIFRQLAYDTSVDTVPGMVEMFIVESQSRIDQVDSLVKSQSLDELRDQVHTLKSLSGTFGAPKLQALSSDLEQACIDEDKDRIVTLASMMPGLYEKTLKHYQKSFDVYMSENHEAGL